MLYLEDILEVIENVPQDIRDRTTDLRELDLGIQNAQDQLEDQIKSFFGNAKKMKPQERDAIYEKIRKDYYRLLDDADEKVTVATNMHDLLERYTRKLDQELEKFKYELEADSPGITEILEKRSLELDEPIKESQKENRYHHHHHHNMPSSRGSSSGSSSSDWRNVVAPIKKEDVLDTQLSNQSLVSVSPPSSLSYTLGQIGAGSNAIAAAASQAIAATQQLQQGRRTASLKASYDAITHGVHPTEFSIGSELANAAQTALAASALPQDHHSGPSSGSGVPGHSGAGKGISGGGSIGSSNGGVQTSSGSGSGSMKAGGSGRESGSSTTSNKRQKKKHSNSASSNNGATSTVAASVAAVALSSSSSSSSTASAASDASMIPTAAVCGVEDSLGGDPSALESPDWTYDPNEPRYCTCNQVSYGDMVACDNPKCPVEWFHYPCVNITAPPKGKWYCPQCAASMNRRQRK